jgi:hypothetical protein
MSVQWSQDNNCRRGTRIVRRLVLYDSRSQTEEGFGENQTKEIRSREVGCKIDPKNSCSEETGERKEAKMILVTLSLLLSLTVGSGNCSGEVDPYTNLTFCELHDIKRQIDSAIKATPLPASFYSQDTLTLTGREAKHIQFLDWKYNIVSSVCFNEDLSVGAYRAGDGSFICINEGKP